MADSKKYDGSTWEHSLRKLTTATDTITTLPVDIYADGNNATLTLKGNTIQNGTPTPQNPIMPQGCGERTANLLYKCIENASISSVGKIVENSSFKIYLAKIEQGETYSLVNNYFAFYTSEPEYDLVSYQGVRYVDSIFTAPIDGYVAVRYRTEDTNAMLNTGSTALPYEPYGYKIPILSNSTTTPIYLGEVQSTRKVKKLVFNGTEEWERAGYPEYNTYFRIPRFTIAQAGNVVCSHYVSPDTNISISNTVQGAKIQNSPELIRVLIVRPPEWRTWDVDDFKAYLAAQYAAGTPVTVWYVLATPETAVVNEPLMKIGDHADTVSGITIPTITGADSFDVLTTLKPSEVELTYTGWHDATVEKWDGSQWNE